MLFSVFLADEDGRVVSECSSVMYTSCCSCGDREDDVVVMGSTTAPYYRSSDTTPRDERERENTL